MQMSKGPDKKLHKVVKMLKPKEETKLDQELVKVLELESKGKDKMREIENTMRDLQEQSSVLEMIHAEDGPNDN